MDNIKDKIYEINGRKVMFDYDLAKLYGYETKRFNEQVNRNIKLFNDNCRFKLDASDVNDVFKSQNATLNLTYIKLRKSFYAFTSEGVELLPNVLKGNDVLKVTIKIIESFKGDEKDIYSPEKNNKMGSFSEVVKFESGDIILDVNVSPEEDTVWLTQFDMALLFDTTIQNISMHITNIYKEKELEKNSTFKNFLNVQMEGDRKINRTFKLYNLDIILSVGYRIKSPRGNEFRKWANNILKQYLMKGYAINTKRCLEHSDILIKLNDDMNMIVNKVSKYDSKLERIEEDIEKIKENFIDENTYKHFLIMNGEKIEADLAYQSIYKLAKKSIYIIDDYIDIKTLQLLKVCKKIEIIIFSSNKANNKINDCYIKDFIFDTGNDLKIKTNNGLFHGRYIIIDYGLKNEIIYHSGPSSKDAGKRIDTITKIEEIYLYKDIVERLLNM